MAIVPSVSALVFLRAPLCPAGHLPHKGGDQRLGPLSPIANVAGRVLFATLPISTQVGEMSGRTEGGAKDRDAFAFTKGATAP
ncbi:hypothetical protein B5V02_30820 [Mesorhizobium kowhaii]|uniref:Lytic murein transglycosylase n=1 Tax=Mesorhizobium kowhaii TaxID=1300272 RepID=A0A2W7BUG2_9HYPH|nr:hypothetical protein B5V02_30820 [Mesorhizobium kowhaii]